MLQQERAKIRQLKKQNEELVVQNKETTAIIAELRAEQRARDDHDETSEENSTSEVFEAGKQWINSNFQILKKFI